jgi:hypothetical protein
MPIIRLLAPGEVPVALLATTEVPLAPATSGVVGTSDYAARADHVHPEQELNPLGVANPLAPGTATPGISTNVSREDHVHPLQTVPALSNNNPLSPGTAAPGTSSESARSDHVHPLQTVLTVDQETVAAAAKTTPVSADLLPLVDSAASNTLKKLSISDLLVYLNIRPRLTANLTLYVRADGNDNNNGLTNTSGGAFLTIQKAVNVALSYDLNSFNLTIQVGSGTYSAVYVGAPPVGFGNLSLVGNTTTPSSVVITSSTAHTIQVDNGGRVNVSGFRLTNTGSNLANILAASQSITIINGNMEFGSTTSSGNHIYSVFSGNIFLNSNYSIVGGGSSHWAADRGGNVMCNSRTITLIGTPAFAGQFAFADINGSMGVSGNTFSGAATGTRYYAQGGGVIQTYGGGANYFPGSVAGSVGTGGYYN